MNKKYLFLAIIPFLIIPTVYALPSGISFEEFCLIKTSQGGTTAATFICELDIFQMNDDISGLEIRVAFLEDKLLTPPYASPSFVATATLDPPTANGTQFNNTHYLTIQTDKISYNSNDIIMISGTVNSLTPDVSLRIFSPSGNIVSVHQVTPSADYTYLVKQVIGAIWNESGDYLLQISHGTDRDETTIILSN